MLLLVASIDFGPIHICLTPVAGVARPNPLTRRAAVEAQQGPRTLDRYQSLGTRLVAQFGEKVVSLTMSLISKMMSANYAQAVLMQRFMRCSV